MSEEPAFLDIPQVEVLHRTALELHGGQDGVRDPAAFESAVMQPRNVWYYAQGDVFDVAAAAPFRRPDLPSRWRRLATEGGDPIWATLFTLPMSIPSSNVFVQISCARSEQNQKRERKGTPAHDCGVESAIGRSEERR